MSSISDVNKIFFSDYDKYNNFIQPKEPLENILFERVSCLASNLNSHIDEVKNAIHNMDGNIVSNSSNINRIDGLQKVFDEELRTIKDHISQMRNILKIISIKSAGLIDEEGVRTLIRMQGSPDQENHVMAEEIINKHMSCLETTFDKITDDGTSGN